MPMKPERQNPFWPAVPQARRAAPRVITMVVSAALILVVATLVARIL